MRNILLMAVLVACGHPDGTDGTEGIDQAVCQPDQPPPCCPTCCDSPIVIDLAGNGLHLTSAVNGVSFALNPSQANQWSWTAVGEDDAFLAIDLNHNGQIDSGEELFGNHSTQVSSAQPNGFLALAWYDMTVNGGNGDGILDARDLVWSKLVLWTDRDHDGWSAPSELTSVSSAVQSFNLAYKASADTDENGNEYKYRSTLVPVPGSTTSIVVTDAWLHTTPASAPGPASCQYEVRCVAWQYMPIGNPFMLRCGVNNGGHNVPVFNLPGPIQGQSYQAELFVYALANTWPTSDTNGIKSGMVESVRSGVRAVVVNAQVAGCAAPYPLPDPYRQPTEPSSGIPDALDNISVACTVTPRCGGCGG